MVLSKYTINIYLIIITINNIPCCISNRSNLTYFITSDAFRETYRGLQNLGGSGKKLTLFWWSRPCVMEGDMINGVTVRIWSMEGHKQENHIHTSLVMQIILDFTFCRVVSMNIFALFKPHVIFFKSTL